MGYYNLTDKQVEALKADERIAYQIQVKTGALTEMDDFSVMPYCVSELSDKIQIGELESGRLPEEEKRDCCAGGNAEKNGSVRRGRQSGDAQLL